MEIAENIAFVNRQKYTPEQQKMFEAAAQYMDEWVCTKVGKMRAYYFCKRDNRGTTPPCGTIIASKMWARKNEDITLAGQKLYCCMCGCKYNANDGMIIEIHKNGHSYFMMAPCPPWEIEDIRNMAMEDSEKFGNKPTARAHL